MPSITDLWPVEEVTKFFFSTNNTFHLIIMMNGVVLYKSNEEINYVSVFRNLVVRIWLRNRPAKLLWNRYNNMQLKMLCLEYIVWYGQFVTNWCDFIKMPFIPHNFRHDVPHDEIFGYLAIWVHFDSKQNGAAYRGIGRDGVVLLLLLKEIRLQLSHKVWQLALMQYVSHTDETDKVSLVL